MALMPMIGRVRLLRHWGGIMDMSMDGSPIIDRTPVEGLYLNAGWCYGGFKATPASGWCFAHLLARDEPHEAARALPPRPLRAPARRSTKRAWAPSRTCIENGQEEMRIACPYCGPRENGEFSYLGDATPVRPALEQGVDAMLDYVYLRDNVAGEMQRALVPRRRLPRLAGGHARHADA